MFENPFTENVAFMALNIGDIRGDELPIEEKEVLTTLATEKRKIEFALGRHSAHKALATLEIKPPYSIGKGTRGEPIWPENIVGSISHYQDWGVAAVANKSTTESIGLVVQGVREKNVVALAKRTCSESERSWIEDDPNNRALRATMLFSAKESFYKCAYPLCKRFIGFTDIELKPAAAGFVATIIKSPGRQFPKGEEFFISCREFDSFILSGIELSQS